MLDKTTNSNYPVARGNRIKALRKYLRYSRRAWCEKHGFPTGTLQNWEDGRNGGLTERGAQRLLGVLNAEGIHTTLEWLLYGIGNDPTGDNGVVTLPQTTGNPIKHDHDAITQELQLFLQLHPHGIHTIVQDDGFSPQLALGFHVAGTQHFGHDIIQCLHEDCIVKTQRGKILVRRLESGSQEGLYHLVCTNESSKNTMAPQNDIALFSAAPIIWIRKPL